MKRSVVALLLCMYFISSFAKPVVIGTFDDTKDEYVYEDSNIVYQDNLRLVWIMTKAKRFNYGDDPDYAGAAGRFIIDCSGHTSVLIEGMTIDKHGKMIQHGVIPKEKWIFADIVQRTPQYTLYRQLCVEAPII